MKALSLSFLSLFILVLVLLPFGRSILAWSTTWRPATCMPSACFCEAIHPAGIRQPSNAWSSLAFVFVGLLIINSPRSRAARSNQLRQPQRLTLAISLIVIGLGSMFYHASLTFVGQFFDVFGMYLLATFILLVNISRRFSVRSSTFVAAYVLSNGLLVSALLWAPEARRYLFAALIILALVADAAVPLRKQTMDRRFLFGAIATLALAFGIWTLDITRVLCTPTSVLQGHAVWHVLGAAAAWFLFVYFNSPNKTSLEIA